MSLLMVKKEVFEWIRTGQKTIELGKEKAEKGDDAVFRCGSNIEERSSKERKAVYRCS